MYSFSYISAERWWQQKHTFVAKLLLMGYLIQLAGISSAKNWTIQLPCCRFPQKERRDYSLVQAKGTLQPPPGSDGEHTGVAECRRPPPLFRMEKPLRDRSGVGPWRREHVGRVRRSAELPIPMLPPPIDGAERQDMLPLLLWI